MGLILLQNGDMVSLVNTISNLSVPALMVLVIYLGMKRTWVWGHHYKELEERYEKLRLESEERLDEMKLERDEYKVMLFRALATAEAAVKGVENEAKS